MPHNVTQKQALVTAVMTLVAGAAMVSAVMGSEHRDAPPFFGRASAESHEALQAPGEKRIQQVVQRAEAAADNVAGLLPDPEDVVGLVPAPKKAIEKAGDTALTAAEGALADGQEAIDGAQATIDQATGDAQERVDEARADVHDAAEGAIAAAAKQGDAAAKKARGAVEAVRDDVHEGLDGLQPTVDRTYALVAFTHDMAIDESAQLIGYAGQLRTYANGVVQSEAQYVRGTLQSFGPMVGNTVSSTRAWAEGVVQEERLYLDTSLDGLAPSFS